MPLKPESTSALQISQEFPVVFFSVFGVRLQLCSLSSTMFSSLLYTLLSCLLVLPLLLYLRNPYLLQDLRYSRSVLQLAFSLTRAKNRKPAYTLLDRLLDLVSLHPHRPFLFFEGSCFTYSQADQHSNRAAWALRNRAGLRSGDTVALFLGNEPRFVWLWLALSKLGCTAALLNSNIRSKSLIHCFSCCDAKVLLVGPGGWDRDRVHG